MEIIGPLIISLIAGLSTSIGSLFIFLKIKESSRESFITFCLSFSLSIMITISLIELIPESTYLIMKEYSILLGIFIILLCLFIGYILINIMDKLIKSSSDLYRVGILSMIALLIHNLPEGIATFLSAYKDFDLGIKLGIAIMMHNIPEGISIAVPIYYSTGNKRKAISSTFISGLAEPLGAILAFLLLKNYITDGLISIVLLIVSGIMITLSISQLLPQAKKYKKDKFILIGLITGIILMIVNLLVF